VYPCGRAARHTRRCHNHTLCFTRLDGKRPGLRAASRLPGDRRQRQVAYPRQPCGRCAGELRPGHAKGATAGPPLSCRPLCAGARGCLLPPSVCSEAHMPAGHWHACHVMYSSMTASKGVSCGLVVVPLTLRLTQLSIGFHHHAWLPSRLPPASVFFLYEAPAFALTLPLFPLALSLPSPPFPPSPFFPYYTQGHSAC